MAENSPADDGLSLARTIPLLPHPERGEIGGNGLRERDQASRHGQSQQQSILPIAPGPYPSLAATTP